MSCTLSSKHGNFLNDKKGKIVLYFTSLRGIRKTYEDCCAVRMIFRGFRVAVDERDISMDSTYKKELQSLLKGKPMSLPQVFFRGNHIGGMEEIRQLNEAGVLAKLLEGLPVLDPTLVCETCGDARFVPCPNCSGSKKVFDEEQEQLRRCPDCNENGLIRCPGCCS
jgi:glutaredoxin domain-containing cysteine-rich protein 1